MEGGHLRLVEKEIQTFGHVEFKRNEWSNCTYNVLHVKLTIKIAKSALSQGNGKLKI
jgi:hypothetical protein